MRGNLRLIMHVTDVIVNARFRFANEFLTNSAFRFEKLKRSTLASLVLRLAFYFAVLLTIVRKLRA